jgi:hypothetical protein
MIRVVRKVHIYAGLLTFAQLIVYGIAGLAATVQPSLERPKAPRSIRYLPFALPPSTTDKQVADLVYRTVQPALARPIPGWFLRRTPDRHLLLDFYNINGIVRVVVLEDEGKVRIEDIRNSAGLFLEDIHAATPGDGEPPGLVRAWAVWNEVAMWSLLGFCVSGVGPDARGSSSAPR